MSAAGGEGRSDRHRVAVVGGGFSGSHAVRQLRHAPVEVTLVDRRNFHLFQPLVYQLATGSLSPGEIAVPLRHVFRHDPNVRVLLGEVTGFDLDDRRVLFASATGATGSERTLQYDSLIVAAGSTYSYFGHDDWQLVAPNVKGLEDAIEVRRRLLTAFEAAEEESDPACRAAWLTFVVVGAGPTGVELAGQIGELTRDTLRHDFRTIDTGRARILLVDLVDRVLPQFPPRLSRHAVRDLAQLGVTPLLGRRVVDIDQEAVTVVAAAGQRERIPARTVVWAAGVQASGLGAALDGAVDRTGRVAVGPDLSLPGRPEVFVVGDMAQVHDVHGRPVALPAVAPAAMQQGRYAAGMISDRLEGRQRPPFTYHDKGSLATIGRERAVVEIKGLQLSGTVAWVTWLFVHLYYLIGLQNRMLVLVRWTVSFITRGRGTRLILSQGSAGERPRSLAADAKDAL